jgi:hypothetical protein
MEYVSNFSDKLIIVRSVYEVHKANTYWWNTRIRPSIQMSPNPLKGFIWNLDCLVVGRIQFSFVGLSVQYQPYFIWTGNWTYFSNIKLVHWVKRRTYIYSSFERICIVCLNHIQLLGLIDFSGLIFMWTGLSTSMEVLLALFLLDVCRKHQATSRYSSIIRTLFILVTCYKYFLNVLLLFSLNFILLPFDLVNLCFIMFI